MPIYEYKCKSCGDVVEIIARVGDRPLTKCRKCSGRMEKLVSRAAFILKGGGWFNEGYNKGDSSESKTKGKVDPSGKDSKSSDKPASKAKTDSKKSSD